MRCFQLCSGSRFAAEDAGRKLATTWFLRQSNEELSNFDTLLLDSLVIEDDDFADWYEENYVLNDID